MKCPCCNGKGRVEYPMYADKEQTIQNAVLRFKTCAYCDGTGEVEMTKTAYIPKQPPTNEQWFCGLSTEEKADALTRKIMDIICWNNDPKPSEVYITIKNWLKREHE